MLEMFFNWLHKLDNNDAARYNVEIAKNAFSAGWQAAQQLRALDASGCTCGSKDDHHTVACYLGQDERQ